MRSFTVGQDADETLRGFPTSAIKNTERMTSKKI